MADTERVAKSVRPIGSREYKAMLCPDGADVAGVSALWGEVRVGGGALGLELPEALKRKKKTRRVEFLDTTGRHLLAADRVLRVRRRWRGGSVDRWVSQLTLKCRVPDRYEATAADLACARPYPDPVHRTRDKLEEDVALPFRSRPSHSNTVEVLEDELAEGRPPLDRVSDAIHRFPGLGPLLRGREGEALTPVRGQVVETLWESDEFALTDRFEEATFAVIVWSLPDAPDTPVVAEISFRYGADDEAYDGEVASLARALFATLGGLSRIDPEARTKTQWIYADRA